MSSNLSSKVSAEWLRLFNCSSSEELYSKLEQIQRKHKVFEGKGVPFSLIKLKYNHHITDVTGHLTDAWIANRCEQLNKELRNNPPKESFENPEVQKFESSVEYQAYSNLIYYGSDLPGSKYNPVGMGYYTELFFFVYFGNYSDFNHHIEKLSEEELRRTLSRREGYPQITLLFAAIIGKRMTCIEHLPNLTRKNIRDIRTMYHGCNENQHFKILENLLKLGADPNAHDILGQTAIYYTLYGNSEECYEFVLILLKYGANPNIYTQHASILKLAVIKFLKFPELWSVVDLLLSNNAKPMDNDEALEIRDISESNCKLELDIRIRDACLKRKHECERTRCKISTVKKCAACGYVVYCSKACQALDWKFHKPICKKKRQEKASQNKA